jgi:putative ABC transport system permease protein
VIKTALKGIAGHRRRLILTGLAIVSGVAFISGTFILTDTLRSSFDDLFGTINEGITAQVRSEAPFSNIQSYTGEREPLQQPLLDELNALPEVSEAEGNVFGYALIIDKEGEAILPQGPPTLGFGWTESDEFNIAELREGRGPTAPNEIAIDYGTFRDNGFAIGDVVQISTFLVTDEYTLVGTFGFAEVDNLLGSTNTVFTVPTAQRVLGVDGFNDISVATADGFTDTQMIAAVEAILPDGVEVISQQDLLGEQNDQLNEGFISIFETALLVFAAVAMFVGAFIIANTFSIIVSQRTRELALLRAVGATPNQVIGMVVIETAVVAMIASIIGVFAGAGIAALLKGAFAATGADLPAAGLVFRPRTFIVGISVGVIVTTVAGLVPAISASRVPPVAAIRDRVFDPKGTSRARLVTGSVITAAGLAALLVGLFLDPSFELAYVGAGALTIFLGVAIFSPLFAGQVTHWIGTPTRRLSGMTGKLARENAERRPVRTAATAAALMVGVALVAFFFIFGESLKVSTVSLIDKALTADMVATGGSLDGPPQPLSPRLATDLEALPEIEVATGVRSGIIQVEGRQTEIGGVDPDRILEVSNLEFLSGGIDGIRTGGLIVHTNRAQEEKLAVGDVFEVEFARTGIQPLEVVGIYEAEEALVGTFNISHATYEANFTDNSDILVFANFAEGVGEEAGLAAVEAVRTSYPSVEVQSLASFKDATEESVNQGLIVITLLLVLTLIIGLLGITNTLALSVFERTREIGLLRAVGMTRRQVRRMVRYEAAIVAVFGAALGLVLGIAFGWLVVQASGSLGIEEFAIPIPSLIVILILSALAGVLAASGPARRASKLNVLEAIAYE